MTALLDANVLIALLVPDHVHHDLVLKAVAPGTRTVATCPITQGAFVRLVVREGGRSVDATASLASLVRTDWHRFVADDVSFDQVDLTGVVGHRQVIDAYLAGLARSHDLALLTLDRGLAAAHADVAELVQ